jgi:phage terminase small subunit
MDAKSEKILKKKPLTGKQKAFCREYIYDWNATRSYLVAYPNTKNAKVAGVLAVRMLANDRVKEYITDIQKDLEKLAGISRMKVISEHMKMAFSSIAHLHDTWIQRKEFESLTDEQKDCIAEIDTKIRTEYEYDPDNPKEKKPIQAEYVKIKLYDKQKALDSISKMLGYDAPQKIEHSGEINSPMFIFQDISGTKINNLS